MIAATDAPSDDHRAELEARRRHLRAGLRAAGQQALMRCSGAIGTAFPVGRDQDADARLDLYEASLAPFPDWALDEAVKRVLRGELGARAFAPSPPEMAKACSDLTLPYRMELDKIDRILDAEIVRDDPTKAKAAAEAIGAAGMDAVAWWRKVVKPEIASHGIPQTPKESPEELLARYADEAAKSRPAPIHNAA